MSKKKLNVAVIGATGYTGLDLVYLLSKHPYVLERTFLSNKDKNLGMFCKIKFAIIILPFCL